MLLIGDIAEQTGLTVSAIRYYEEIGLIEPTGRSSGRRVFAESTTRRIRAISAARDAGFTLNEIRRLLDSQHEGTDEWTTLVEAKIAEVAERISRLRAVETMLRESLTCGCSAWDSCPIVLT